MASFPTSNIKTKIQLQIHLIIIFYNYHFPDACVSFLRRQAHSLQLPIQVHSVGGNPRFPFAVITWTGSDPTQGAVLLNSHMDVVPVYRDTWSHDPFGAEIDADGRIFARGAQDMKCVSCNDKVSYRSERFTCCSCPTKRLAEKVACGRS